MDRRVGLMAAMYERVAVAVDVALGPDTRVDDAPIPPLRSVEPAGDGSESSGWQIAPNLRCPMALARLRRGYDDEKQQKWKSCTC